MSQGEEEFALHCRVDQLPAPKREGKGWARGLECVPRRKCESCGTMFYAPPSQIKRNNGMGGRFCSGKCYGVSIEKKCIERSCRVCGESITINKNAGSIPRVCLGCKKPRGSKEKVKCLSCGNDCDGKFCNMECYTNHRRQNASPKRANTPNSKCEACGDVFYASPGHRRNGWGRYCSMKCRPLPRHGNAKGGKRPDLDNLYVRSSWEANYARYLNFLVKNRAIKSWEYEPITFEFEGIKRGTRFYTPDFLVIDNDGAEVFHEVKGYMDQKSKTKLKRMSKYHPSVKVIIIGGQEMKEIKKKVSALIEHWETHTNDKL